jgi:hypothetical protein
MGDAAPMIPIPETQDNERLPNADRCRSLEMVHQQIGERRADHGPAAKPHDGHAGCHPAPVRKPLNESRNRGNITKAKADAAEHART